MEVTRTGATSDTVAAAELPFRLAVRVDVLSDAIVPTVMLKVADAEPAATLTEAGDTKGPLLDATATVAPPFNAGLDSVTVQVLVVFGPNDAGAH